MLKPQERENDLDTIARLADVGRATQQPRTDRAPPSPRKSLLLLSLAIITAMAISAFATHQFLKSRPSESAAATEVAADAGNEGPGSSGPGILPPAVVLEASGYVVARNKASVSSDITGRIRSIQVTIGQGVRAGDIIAVLDDREARLRLAAARLQMQQNELQADNGRVNLQLEQDRFERVRQLSGEGFASRASLDQAQAELESARIQMAQAEVLRANGTNGLRAAEILVERHVIRAPFDGVIVEVTARPGETVSPTSGGNSFIRTGIVQLVDPASLYVAAEVPERQIGLVEVGQHVQIVSTGAGNRVSSRVAWISSVSDRQRGIIEAGIDLPSTTTPFIDGMEVSVRFLRPSSDQNASSEGGS